MDRRHRSKDTVPTSTRPPRRSTDASCSRHLQSATAHGAWLQFRNSRALDMVTEVQCGEDMLPGPVIGCNNHRIPRATPSAYSIDGDKTRYVFSKKGKSCSRQHGNLALHEMNY